MNIDCEQYWAEYTTLANPIGDLKVERPYPPIEPAISESCTNAATDEQ